jgi:hypothetical protein
MDEKKLNSEGNLAPHKLMMLITVVHKGKGTFFADFIIPARRPRP